MSETKKSRIFAVLGDPVEHSASPRMHNAGFAARGLPHCYLRARIRPSELRRALSEARRLEVGGLNLTVPLKETALSLVDSLTPRARAIGAVNTIVPTRGRLIGDNTDGEGFLRSLQGRVRLNHARIVVLGAGGSARAVGTALAAHGTGTLVLANRTRARAEALATRLESQGPRRRIEVTSLEDPALLEDATLVVNTTSAGLHGEALPIRPATSRPACLFVDLVYGRSTPFLRSATRARRAVADGSEMLLYQGALAFEAWTDLPAPILAMRRALGVPPPALSGVRTPRRGTA